MLERSRAEALNPDVGNVYFGLLGETLDKLGLKNTPRQMFNCDETFLPLDCNKEIVTLPCGASAAGTPHPPMIIYSKYFSEGLYHFEGTEDALYSRSESGWINTELFLAWLKKIFLKFVVVEHQVIRP